MSKRRYRICICSVVLEELEPFSQHQGLQYYFPVNFRCNLTYYESENFSDSSLYHSFEAESFRFPLWEEKVDEFKFLGN